MSKSRDIADSAATINYIDGLTSDAQGQIDTATSDIATNASDIATKAPLSDPTFTGTVTATAFSGDGSGLTGVDSLPSQTGNNGLFLTTDGSTASWAEAGGGAWELLNTYTASNVTSVEITDFSSTYDDYVIIIDRISATDYASLQCRLRIGGSIITSGYYWTNPYATFGNASIIQLTDYALSDSPTATNHAYGSAIINISSANDSIHHSLTSIFKNFLLGNLSTGISSGFQISTSGVLSGIQFFASVNNILTADFKIYGIKKS